MRSITEVKSSLHISIPSKLLEQLNNYTEEAGKSRNQIIAELIAEWIEDQEDIKVANKVLQDIKTGKTKAISWDGMKRNLGWD